MTLTEGSGPDSVQTVTDRPGILALMQRAAPPGADRLPAGSVAELRGLTTRLIDADRAAAEEEYERFLDVHARGLDLDHRSLTAQLAGRTVLVTGGTGCIGTVLLDELGRYGPARIVTVSRGVTVPARTVRGVEYRTVDVADRAAVMRVVREVAPDIIYHLAAQRDPGLAEREVGHTLRTNVFGTRNVVEAAEAAGVPQVVYASTGKALRPYTPDTYAASKKAGEWVMTRAAARGRVRCSAVRFTHVVDNSIIFRRLRDWVARGDPVRLHGPEIVFYLQSARESAHLLLNAGLEPGEGVLSVHSIRDLEWPMDLLSLALGTIAHSGSAAPVYICGYENGYEEQAYPGLYDPRTAGCLSPLVSAFEAHVTVSSETCRQVDVFPLRIGGAEGSRVALERLSAACAGDAPDAVLHRAKHDLSWAVLDAMLDQVPEPVLRKAADRRRPEGLVLAPEHERTDRAVYAALARREIPQQRNPLGATERSEGSAAGGRSPLRSGCDSQSGRRPAEKGDAGSEATAATSAGLGARQQISAA